MIEKSPLRNEILSIMTNDRVAPGIFRLEFTGGEIAGVARPGQFVHVKCGDTTDPLLRRPFSINNAGSGIISVLYQVKGIGTRKLSALKAGQALDVIGPLGNGFEMIQNSKCLVVAGGIGLAPMRFLINGLAEKGNSVTLLYGCGTSDYLKLAENLSEVCQNIHFSTDDGSAGTKGFVTDIDIDWSLFDMIYSCGPEPMLEAVAGKAGKSGVTCQVSLERHMACGVGACLGCVCSLKDGASGSNYSRVCVDGPVYDSKEVRW